MMLRRFLFEWEDQPWFPDVIRSGMLDFLAFFTKLFRLYHPAVPLIAAKMRDADTDTILDMASGGGGPLASIWKEIHEANPGIRIILTDLFPNTDAYIRLSRQSCGVVTGEATPHDAMTGVRPTPGKAIYTMFSAMHHFPPHLLRALMQRSQQEGETLLIFDGGGIRLLLALGVLLQIPVFLLITPFLRPFRWSRLVFTYLIPLIPVCTVWDGLVSVARLYCLKELKSLATSEQREGYRWQAGAIRHLPGVRINFLAGAPVSSSS